MTRPEEETQETKWSAGKDYYKLLLSRMNICAHYKLTNQIAMWSKEMDNVNDLVLPFIKTKNFGEQIDRIQEQIRNAPSTESLNTDLKRAQQIEYSQKLRDNAKKLKNIQRRMYIEMKQLLLPLVEKSSGINPFGSGD